MYFVDAVFVIVSVSWVVSLTESASFNATITNDDFIPYSGDPDRLYWTLIKRVASSFEENFLLSPLGLKLTLSLLKEASAGVTQAELSSIFRDDLNRTDSREHLKSIAELLKKKPPKNIAYQGSWIFIPSENEKRARFEAVAKYFYNVDITTVNTQSPTVTANEINQVVLNATLGNILNTVNEDDVASVAVIVLNALYFKGSWRHQFAPNATKYDQFYITPNVIKEIPFMNLNEKFYYTESAKLAAKILRMPYLGNKFSMYIIVPNDLLGLSRVMSNINVLRTEMNNLREHSVDVKLPKFKFDYTSQLGGILKELGVREVFEDTASFPGIARGQCLSERIKISKVLQRSGIEVNELGSVAYAATEIALVNKFGEDTDSQVEVVANRPFLFFIQDELTRQLLVTGRVSDPTLLDGAFKLVESVYNC